MMPQVDEYQQEAILKAFGIDDQPRITSIPQGHIHFSYRLETDKQIYLLQCLNTDIFPNTQDIFDNVIQVQNKLEAALKDDYPFRWYLTKDSKPFIDLEDGTRWRLMRFIPDTISHGVCKSDQMAWEAGRILGQMHKYTYNIPTQTLHEVIPNFHDMSFRIKQLEQAVKEDSAGRLEQMVDHLFFLMDEKDQWLEVVQDIRDGKILMHATHNDPKLENILFDQKGNAVCLIDLDTVMGGCYFFDVGDLIRSCCTPYPEDDPVQYDDAFNLAYFTKIIQAYADETKTLLHQSEQDSLIHAGAYMTFIMAVRFLTDYLNGDIYYQVKRASHNLDRFLNQANLYRRIQSQKESIKQIITQSFQ